MSGVAYNNGIAKGSIMDSVLFSMSWLWVSVNCPTEDMFTSVGCIAEVLWEGGDLKDRDNTVNTLDILLLRGFVYSLVKEEPIDRKSTAIEVLGYDFPLVETEMFPFRGSKITLLFSLL